MSTTFRLALATVLIFMLIAWLRYAPPAWAGSPPAAPCPGVELMIQPEPLPPCPTSTPEVTPEQDIGTPSQFIPLPDTAMEAPR